MPYYIYRIIQGPTALIKNLEKVSEYDSFKEAQQQAKQLRTELSPSESAHIKVIFANNPLEAEERLQEQREAPILREWEK